jgi:hypothetical protein
VYWTSYFILNAIGGIYEIIKFQIKPVEEYPNNPDIPQYYKQMNPAAKIALKCFTFLINVLFWLPFKIIKPLAIKL